jgi:hypothetical protein
MKTTVLKIENMTVAKAFPDAVAAANLVDATRHLPGRSIRSIRETAGRLLSVAKWELEKASSDTAGLRVEMEIGRGCVVARGFDEAAVCIDNVAFAVSIEDIYRSNERVRDAQVQANENRRAEISAEIGRLEAHPKSHKRDEQIRLLTEVLVQAA